MCSLVMMVSTGIQWAAHKRWIGSFSRSREGGWEVRESAWVVASLVAYGRPVTLAFM